jgi:hypothetical protein
LAVSPDPPLPPGIPAPDGEGDAKGRTPQVPPPSPQDVPAASPDIAPPDRQPAPWVRGGTLVDLFAHVSESERRAANLARVILAVDAGLAAVAVIGMRIAPLLAHVMLSSTGIAGIITTLGYLGFRRYRKPRSGNGPGTAGGRNRNRNGQSPDS